MLQETRNIIREEAIRQGVDPDLMIALAIVESNGIPKTARFEKNFQYYFKDQEFAKLQGISLDTERMFQKTSFGVLHLMGGTARWLGYSSWLPDLCEPRIGALWGCVYFKRVCSKQIYLNDQIAVYNAGSVRRKIDGSYTNQEYVDKVLLTLSHIKPYPAELS